MELLSSSFHGRAKLGPLMPARNAECSLSQEAFSNDFSLSSPLRICARGWKEVGPFREVAKDDGGCMDPIALAVRPNGTRV